MLFVLWGGKKHIKQAQRQNPIDSRIPNDWNRPEQTITGNRRIKEAGKGLVTCQK